MNETDTLRIKMIETRDAWEKAFSEIKENALKAKEESGMDAYYAVWNERYDFLEGLRIVAENAQKEFSNYPLTKHRKGV